MNVVIDKNKPITKKRVGRPSKYPFDKMAKGDSFFVENGSYGSLMSCANNYAKGTTKKFICDKGIQGVRVWRIK